MKGKSAYKVIAESFCNFKISYLKVLGASILTIGTILGLTLFPLFGIFLAYFAMGFLCLGQKKFVLGVLTKKKVKVETVFSCYKKVLSAFALKTLILVYSAIWGLLLIIPGIIYMLNASFSSFIMAEEDIDALSALEKSKKMTNGYRTKILTIFLLCALMGLIFASVGYAICLLIGLFVAIPKWIVILAVILTFMVGLILVIMPFFEYGTAIIYLEAKNAETKTSKKA